MADLFRKEAIVHQRQRLEGEVTLATHPSFSVIALLLMAVVITGVIYLFWGEYHRKEVVPGYLRPSTGLSKVYAVTPGLVDEIYVKEGDIVEKGQPLARIRIDRHLRSGQGVHEVIMQELRVQKALIQTTIDNQNQLYQTNRDKLASQIANTTAMLEQAKRQRTLLEARVTLSQNKAHDINALMSRGFAAQRELDSQQDNVLALKQELENTHSHILSIHEKLNQLVYQSEQLPIEHKNNLSTFLSELAGVKQQISQTDSQRNLEIVSNKAGEVTNLLVKNGMMANINQPIMTILPVEAHLEAVLYVPTRAYGFVSKGQKTRIRYQAFPYQRFGIYEGHIVKVSKAVMLPSDASLPVSFNEPVYPVIVKLEQQDALAYGLSVPLQSGMLLEADIMVDKRALFEWLFKPFYSIKGAV